MTKLLELSKLNRTQMLHVAYLYAKAAHAGQLRDDGVTPHVEHCKRVAYRVAAMKDPLDETIIAAMLHDTVEDTGLTLGDILTDWGSSVAAKVAWLTDEYTPEKYPRMNRRARKREEAWRIAKAPLDVRMVKAIDRADNLRDMELRDAEDAAWLRVFLTESKELHVALIHRSPLPGTVERDLGDAILAADKRLTDFFVEKEGALA